MSAPADRLAASREQLRLALQQAAAQRSDAAAPGRGGRPASWLNSLSAFPGAQILIDAASAWWLRHPLHVSGVAAAAAAKAVLHPLARRHPLTLVFGALLFGVLFAWSRPWRWIRGPGLVAVGMLPQLLLNTLAHQRERRDAPLP